MNQIQSSIRATHTPNPEDSLINDFPGFLGSKKGQNQPSKKANPQSKQKSGQNLRDHGDSYQTAYLNSDMSVENLGSRKVNGADGCFSSEDLLRRIGNHGRPNQIVEEIKRDSEENSNDVDPETARRRLGEISLKDLPMTKTGKFDGRSREVKDYLSLCTSADVEPYEYYQENLNKKPEPVPHRGPQKLNKGKDQTALKELKNFPLNSLKWTQSNTLDMRANSCKEFKTLCETVGVDPEQYFLENFSDEQEQQTESIREQPKSPKSEKSLRPVYQPHDGLRRVESDQEAALRKLRDFPLNELHITKKNLLDMRRNNSKDFLMLCDNAGVDPMEYYFEHMGNPSNNLSNSISNINSSNISILSESNVTLTKNNKLDKRFSSTKDFIKEKVSEAEMRLSQFDTSQLKRKKDGELDKRVKANKEYMELQEQTQESYWENMKFVE